jgi:hypothetical protein
VKLKSYYQAQNVNEKDTEYTSNGKKGTSTISIKMNSIPVDDISWGSFTFQTLLLIKGGVEKETKVQREII